MQERVQAALTRLAPVLAPGGAEVRGLQRLTAGASLETWRFDGIAANGAVVPLILRRRGDGPDAALDTALPLASEAALLTAAGGAGAPVPAVVRVCGPGDGLGEALIVSRVEGETLGRRIAAGAEFEAARSGLGRQAGAALAAIHAVRAPHTLPVAGLSARETVARYAELYRATGPAQPVMETAIRWLRARMPAEGASLLVHGDFRNGNLIVHPEKGLVAVLDWELAHLGDPAEDIGWITVNSWRFGVVERPVGGFAMLDEFLSGYEDAGGAPPSLETIRFWRLLGSFRWAAMTRMLAARVTARDPGATLERAVIATRMSECEVDILAAMDGAG